MDLLERVFRLAEHKTTVRTELWAGLTTFLTMAYIIFVQPQVLSGAGMDFHAVTAATCYSAALASAIMGLYGRYPIAQAPGMGENFFFVGTVVPAAGVLIAQQVRQGTLAPDQVLPWQVALGVVFISGVIFLGLTFLGLRTAILESISPSMRNAIAVGIGLFIAFIGMKNVGLIVLHEGKAALAANFASPDMIVFGFGLLLTAGLYARGVRGSIFWGIVAATLLSVALKLALPLCPEAVTGCHTVTDSSLVKDFTLTAEVVSRPPSLAPTLLQMDLRYALAWPMVPFILIFLFMLVFDTVGTLVGVAEQAGLMHNGKLPRASQAFASDALGTVAGAALGTSTVTSFIESTAGVEQGGRTGLTALTAAALFLLALFFSPLVAMIGKYPPITAPALVVVGSMMIRGVTRIEWSNYAEAMPAFLVILGIPLSYSIADGLALGFISYPIVKLLAGQRREVSWLSCAMAAVLVAYFALVRAAVG